MTSPSLPEALDTVVTVARQSGVPESAARVEALMLAAAIAESAPGAAVDWVAAQPGTGTQDFFDAAVRGRRWRGAPTAILIGLVARGAAERVAYAEALAAVAAAACGLGEPTVRVIGNASVAAAAQLRAAGAARTSPNPGTPTSPTAGTATSPRAGTAGGVATAGESAAVAEAAEEPPSVDELLAELDGLIGLEKVKREVHRQVALLRMERLRTEAGLRSPTVTRHLVFVGNPGTGKTTVARLVSGIYHALGLLTKGQLVEVDRSELVAGYLGQTAVKTAEVVASATGGVLFVDEAYSLAGDRSAFGTGPDQYGQEAVDTLVKEMEDRRGDLVVIVAGYPEPMRRFIAANPGLASRFRTTIEFDDYTEDELVEILVSLAADADYEITPGAVDRFRKLLAATRRDESFGNGRFARNVLEAAIGRHAWRLRDVTQPTSDQLRQILATDLTDDPTTPTDLSHPPRGESTLSDHPDSLPGADQPGRGSETVHSSPDNEGPAPRQSALPAGQPPEQGGPV